MWLARWVPVVSADERWMRISVAFARAVTKSPDAQLCAACVDVLAVSGVGITIMGGGQAGPVCVSDQRMAALEDLQFTLGAGPCQDAFRFNQPVHTPRLNVATTNRWPSFLALAEAAGIGAVFAYPLASAGVGVGVLTIYQDQPGDLSPTQDSDSTALADVLTETVLSLQDAAPAGTLATGLDEAVAYRAEIYQASGMVSIQLQIPVTVALARIRAYAFSQNRPIAAIAADIVTRRLRLADDRHEPPEGA